MIIDGHSHVTLPIQDHIKAMDSATIDKTILFPTTFHPETSANFSEIKASMDYLNDLLAGKKGAMEEARRKAVSELVEAIAQHPDRYVGFGAVPLYPDVKSTLEYVDDVIFRNRLAGDEGADKILDSK